MEKNKFAENLSAMSLEERAHVLNLPHHLTESLNFARLNKVLTDFQFLQAKVSEVGPQSLIADYEYLFRHKSGRLRDKGGLNLHNLKIVCDTLKLSSPVLETNPRQLPSQLLGRLLDEKDPGIRRLLEQSKQSSSDKMWLRPVSRSLIPPGSPVIRVFTQHSNRVSNIIVTKDGETAISGDDAGNLKAWKPSTCEQMWSASRERSLKLTTDQRYVINASHENIVKILDIRTGKLVRELEHGCEGVNTIAITPDDSILVFACEDKTLKLVDFHTGETIRCLKGHGDEVASVAITPDGKGVLSGSAGQRDHLKLWDLHSGNELKDFAGHALLVSSVAITSNGRYTVSGSWDNDVIVWDLKSGKQLHTLKGHHSFVTSVAIAADSKILSGSWDKKIKVWDLIGGKDLYTLEGHSDWINSIAVTGDGKYVISASSDQTVRVWALK